MILKASIKILLIGFAAFFTAQNMPGFEIDEVQTLIIVTTMVALVNAMFTPVISWLSFPFTILTIALVVFAMNALVIRLADGFIDGFSVKGWTPPLLFSMVITIVSVGTDKFLLRRSY
jgi:putative membrane protein